MSAELLRQITIERVNKEIAAEIEALVELHDQPLDMIRVAQGRIAGLKRAVEIQNESYKGMG